MSGRQNFWARRRAGVVAEAQAEEAALQARVQAEEQAEYEEMDEAQVLAALDLPDPDTLKTGDDFTAFMAKAVPDQIRRRALRTLWRSNPVLANVDMLVDYGEDFTDSAMVIENMQTAYQVGKGMLKHIEEMARQAEELANPVAEPEGIEEEPAEDEVLMVATEDTAPKQMTWSEEGAVESYDDDEDDVYATLTPRRMKFRIEETA